MSRITINVDFLAGTSIEDAVKEAKEKAIKWGVAYVSFKFNGVKMSISRNADLNSAVNDFGDALSGKSCSRFVVS